MFVALLAILFGCLVWTPPSFAESLSLPVYRTPKSQFHSGHAFRADLKNGTKSIKELWWFQIELKNGEKRWAHSSDLIFRSDFYVKRTSQSFRKFSRPGFVSSLPEKFVFSKKGAIFYSAPKLDASVLLLTNPGTEFEILDKPNGDWIYAKLGKLRGFLLREQLISQSDLIGNDFVFSDFSSPTAYTTPSFQSKSIALKYGQRFRLLHRKVEVWGKSQLPSLGTIWWHASRPTKKATSAKLVEAEGLLDKPIYDMATMPVSPFNTYVSAGGVFKSTKTGWKALPGFKKSDHPIAISKKGTIFIGSFYSEDFGQSFKPYIHWPKLLKVLKQSHLSQLKIGSIEIIDSAGNELLLTANIKKSRKKIYTRNRGKTWSLVQ